MVKLVALGMLCHLVAVTIAAPQVNSVSIRLIRLITGNSSAPFIVMGTRAEDGEIPFHADLWGCGGSLIHPKWVLTAAHCLSDATSVRVSMGSVHIHNMSYVAWSDKIYLHENYNDDTLANDIALIKLPWPARGENIATVQIAPRDIGPLDGKIVRASGFGDTGDTAPGSDVLLKVNLKVVSNQKCKKFFNKISKGQICSIFSTRVGENTCQGDSGGPLTYIDPAGNIYVIGITSFGGDCEADKPSVNTRVSAYVNWIKRIMGASK